MNVKLTYDAFTVEDDLSETKLTSSSIASDTLKFFQDDQYFDWTPITKTTKMVKVYAVYP